MIARSPPARFERDKLAAIAADKSVSSGLWNAPWAYRLSSVSSPKTCDRSGREAVAVRGRSFEPKPGRCDPPGAGAAAAALASRLTPARWQSRNWRRQLEASIGTGDAVLVGTAQELRENSQAVVFVADCARFSRFSVFASRHVRGGAHAPARASCEAVFSRTREPTINLFVFQRDRGSYAVLERFSSEPVSARLVSIARLCAWRDILGGQYPARGLAGCVDRPISSLLRSRAAQSFGVFAWSAGPIGAIERLELGAQLVDQGGSARRVKSGTYDCRSARVGRPMLEGKAQGLGAQRFSGARPLPVRLAHPAPAAIAQGTPLCPHSRRPQALACRHASAPGFGSPFPASVQLVDRSAKSPVGRTGRGELALGQGAKRQTGRGAAVPACDFGGKALRRRAQASGGVGCVN